MWIDLSKLGMKIIQSTDNGKPEGTIIFIANHEDRPSEFDTRHKKLLDNGFEKLGMVPFDEKGEIVIYHAYRIHKVKFNLSDIKSWVDGFEKTMIQKDSPIPYQDIYEIMERISIHEENRIATFEGDEISFCAFNY